MALLTRGAPRRILRRNEGEWPRRVASARQGGAEAVP
jgi:hypothetical protein